MSGSSSFSLTDRLIQRGDLLYQKQTERLRVENTQKSQKLFESLKKHASDQGWLKSKQMYSKIVELALQRLPLHLSTTYGYFSFRETLKHTHTTFRHGFGARFTPGVFLFVCSSITDVLDESSSLYHPSDPDTGRKLTFPQCIWTPSEDLVCKESAKEQLPSWLQTGWLGWMLDQKTGEAHTPEFQRLLQAIGAIPSTELGVRKCYNPLEESMLLFVLKGSETRLGPWDNLVFLYRLKHRVVDIMTHNYIMWSAMYRCSHVDCDGRNMPFPPSPGLGPLWVNVPGTWRDCDLWTRMTKTSYHTVLERCPDCEIVFACQLHAPAFLRQHRRHKVNLSEAKVGSSFQASVLPCYVANHTEEEDLKARLLSSRALGTVSSRSDAGTLEYVSRMEAFRSHELLTIWGSMYGGDVSKVLVKHQLATNPRCADEEHLRSRIQFLEKLATLQTQRSSALDQCLEESVSSAEELHRYKSLKKQIASLDLKPIVLEQVRMLQKDESGEHSSLTTEDRLELADLVTMLQGRRKSTK